MLRSRILYIAGLLAFATLVFFWIALRHGSFDTVRGIPFDTVPGKPFDTVGEVTTSPKESRLHLLVVATNSGLDLCRLLLSASVLLYPSPVFIDWAGTGAFNASQSHLAKIAGPLRYLDNLSPLQDTDIVLLVDGFDVTFQLGPDVLLKRYFQETAAANERLVARFGNSHVQKHNMYNSIIFGPDKVCWPKESQRAACWAVPDSTLPPDAFGPFTDKIEGDMPHARPRWLNSGTIMGPAAEMREMFRATQDKIDKTYNPDYVLRDSDQMYFADVWGDQEYARTMSLGDKLDVYIPKSLNESDKPMLESNQVVEYHIGLDYISSLFQTAAGYRNYLAWMTLNSPSLPPTQKTIEPYRIDLQQDVLDSRKPFAIMSDDTTQKNTSWRDVPLGVNTATGLAFPIMHYTGDKSFRDTWWSRMWYFHEAERLQRASAQIRDDNIGTSPIDGTRWLKNTPYKSNNSEREEKSGAWSDVGEELSWDRLCKPYEDALYNEPAQLSSDST